MKSVLLVLISAMTLAAQFGVLSLDSLRFQDSRGATRADRFPEVAASSRASAVQAGHRAKPGSGRVRYG